MKRVKRFGVFQTAKVAAITIALVVSIVIIPFWLINGLYAGVTGNHFPGLGFGEGIFYLLMPFIYGIVGFILTALCCLLYNFMAKWTGGIELEIDTVDEPNN